MENVKLAQEGARQWEEYLEALERATPAQAEEANRQVALHLSEYGHSFAQEILKSTQS